MKNDNINADLANNIKIYFGEFVGCFSKVDKYGKVNVIWENGNAAIRNNIIAGDDLLRYIEMATIDMQKNCAVPCDDNNKTL